MPKNAEAREWGAQLIREVVDRAAQKGDWNSTLTRMARVGAGSLECVSKLANGLGYQLAIQPPEEKDSGKWYSMGGQWKEILKAMVFHWWTREDEELIETGREVYLDYVTRDTKLRRDLHDAGLSADSFTDWLQKGKVPTMESFCILAMFERYKIEWREVKK